MSAECLRNTSCPLNNSYIMNEDHSLKNPVQKQGIVSILSSDFNSNKNPNFSIRRTLSADMSSPKWLQNNGFSQSSVKRVQSSEQLGALCEEDNNIGVNDHDHGKSKGGAYEDIWSSIQADKRSWGTILSPAKNDGSGPGSGSESGSLPPPYVHPLAKRTASSLSEKSLEICTESLGSETGSDVFSYPASEPEDSDKEQEQEQEHEEEQVHEVQQEVEVKDYSVEVGNCNYKYSNNYYRGPTSKRSMMVPLIRPSFPPPLPSLAHRHDGSNLHIRSHRQDGRLVVEAVSVPSQNCFRVQRQDGRLVLTLASNDHEQEQEHEQEHEQEQEQEQEKDELVEVDEVVEEEEDNVEEEEEVIQKGVINVQRSCTSLTMRKLMELTSTRNKSTWPRNYNTTVIKTLDENDEEVEDDDTTEVTMAQSLPPRPRVSTATAAAVALNAYEYYWRRGNSPTAAAVAVLKPLAGQQNNNKKFAPQVEKDTKKNNKLLFAAHNKKGVALAQEEVVLVKAAGRGGGASTREKGEYLVPLMLRGCKEPKRSLLFWEPYCIATS